MRKASNFDLKRECLLGKILTTKMVDFYIKMFHMIRGLCLDVFFLSLKHLKQYI